MSSSALQALIFDVDGTLADTESAHLAAFNRAFFELGIDWVWDAALYTTLLDISGGKERIEYYWRQYLPDTVAIGRGAARDVIACIHALKNAHYVATVDAGGLALRPGVVSLIHDATEQGLRLAIATTTTPVNIAALLRTAMGADWRAHFAAIGDAATAPIKKPHPQVYMQVLRALQLPPEACLAFEDSANGLKAAVTAGLATIVTPTHFTLHHDFGAALRVVPDLSDVDLVKLNLWRGAPLLTATSQAETT